jgi:hypothetical protein
MTTQRDIFKVASIALAFGAVLIGNPATSVTI